MFSHAWKCLCTLPKRVDCFLRNRPFRGEDARVHLSVWEVLFDDQPWYTEWYYKVRRGIRNVWDFPRDTYYDAKYFIQRGKRGWADRDTWALDNYLSRWLPDALKHLKANKHGTPMDMFDGLPMDEDSNPTHESHDIASKRWDDTMDKMIAAFDAWNRMEEGLYEDILGPYPLGRPKGVTREAWEAHRHERFLKSEELRKRDEAIFDAGMALFGKHFGSLWD